MLSHVAVSFALRFCTAESSPTVRVGSHLVILVTWRLGSLRTLQMNTTQLRPLKGWLTVNGKPLSTHFPTLDMQAIKDLRCPKCRVKSKLWGLPDPIRAQRPLIALNYSPNRGVTQVVASTASLAHTNPPGRWTSLKPFSCFFSVWGHVGLYSDSLDTSKNRLSALKRPLISWSAVDLGDKYHGEWKLRILIEEPCSVSCHHSYARVLDCLCGIKIDFEDWHSS